MTTVAPEAPASRNARTSVVLSLQQAGITDEDKQRHVCGVWARRPIGSRTELTEREARSLAARVKTMSPAELAAVLARPVPDPPELDGALRAEIADVAAELPPGVIVCGGDPTPEDAAQVRAFAEFLDTAGVPPTVEELDAVREEPEPVTWSTMLATEDPPAPPSPTSEAEAIEQRGEPVPVEPPPADIEQAAEDAVRRFRERLAAGIVPEPPSLSSIPPRVPVELAPRPDRYCMATCYCGGCKHWAPPAPVDYSKTPGSKDYERIHGKWR